MLQVSNSSKIGRDFLVRRSTLGKRFLGLATPSDILVVDDSADDATVLSLGLRILFGQSLTPRLAGSVGAMKAAVRQRLPDLIFLDDLIEQSRAELSIPVLRSLGYDGPIIVVSSLVTRMRLAELTRLGAVDVIHKDDLESSRLREAILKALSVD